MTTEVFSPDEPRVNEPDANELNANAPEPPPIRVVVADDQPVVLAAMVLSALLIWRHRGNIKRLLAGQEPRVGQKKTAP